MRQTEALDILNAGANVFLTGAPGAGKTYVLNEFIRQARADGASVAVTASTGIASTHINGQTIHSWSGVGVATALSPSLLKLIRSRRKRKIQATDILVIDEVSMLHAWLFDMVDQVCREVRRDPRPFGGIQVVLSGDFFQLPPVSVLTVLTDIREGDVTQSDRDVLVTRLGKLPEPGQVAVHLFPVNRQADNLNDMRLNQIMLEPHEFHAETAGSANLVDRLKKNMLAPERLVLKEGAAVMALRNDTDRQYVNGSLGTVRGFAQENKGGWPIVEFENGNIVTMWRCHESNRWADCIWLASTNACSSSRPMPWYSTATCAKPRPRPPTSWPTKAQTRSNPPSRTNSPPIPMTTSPKLPCSDGRCIE